MYLLVYTFNNVLKYNKQVKLKVNKYLSLLVYKYVPTNVITCYHMFLCVLIILCLDYK